MANKLKVNGNKTIQHHKINAKLGLTDKLNHNVFYMEGGTFLIPTDDVIDFSETMNDVESYCKRLIKNKLLYNNFLDTNFIMNFEICSNRMKKNKHSYLSFQYHFRQRHNDNYGILEIKKNNESFFVDLLNDIECALDIYNINISKTKIKK